MQSRKPYCQANHSPAEKQNKGRTSVRPKREKERERLYVTRDDQYLPIRSVRLFEIPSRVSHRTKLRVGGVDTSLCHYFGPFLHFHRSSRVVRSWLVVQKLPVKQLDWTEAFTICHFAVPLVATSKQTQQIEIERRQGRQTTSRNILWRRQECQGRKAKRFPKTNWSKSLTWHIVCVWERDPHLHTTIYGHTDTRNISAKHSFRKA